MLGFSGECCCSGWFRTWALWRHGDRTQWHRIMYGVDFQVDIPAPPCPSAWGWSWKLQHWPVLCGNFYRCNFWRSVVSVHMNCNTIFTCSKPSWHWHTLATSALAQVISSQWYTSFHVRFHTTHTDVCNVRWTRITAQTYSIDVLWSYIVYFCFRKIHTCPDYH